MNDKLRLCISLLIAALGSNPLRREAWRRLGKAVKLWLGGLQEGGKVSDEIYQKRIDACRQCPISFQRFGLLTCGSPLMKGPDLHDGQEKQCWCDMLIKARLNGASCWLDDTLGEAAPSGWRKAHRA